MSPRLVLAVLLASLAAGPAQPQPEGQLRARAREILKRSPLIDVHNDFPWAVRDTARLNLAAVDIARPQPQLMTDIPRLRTGGVGGQFWSVYVPAELKGGAAVTATLEQIDIVQQMLRKYPDVFELAVTAADVERVFRSGRIASLIGMEGGHSIDNSLGALRTLFRAGARYMTLTHSANTAWADAATDMPLSGGLSAFGEEVVREMNWLGMLVDLSHVSTETMEDALQVTAAPVIFSHSSARALSDVSRNVPDHVLRMLPRNGGIVMVAFVPRFLSGKVAAWTIAQTAEEERLRQASPGDLAAIKAGLAAWESANPAPRATIADAADHVDHIRKVAGIDHVGLGADFDGISAVAEGLEDVSTYPALLAELLRRGYSADDIRKVAGLNILRVMRHGEQVSRTLQSARGPSTVLFAQP